jgi:hypothetical protein
MATTISRSALPVLRRLGLADEPVGPRPRFNASDLLVHTIPLNTPPNPAAGVLQNLEGVPSPDRGGTRPWPDDA